MIGGTSSTSSSSSLSSSSLKGPSSSLAKPGSVVNLGSFGRVDEVGSTVEYSNMGVVDPQ